ncbi:sugar nucleotide-binding protein, partial [Glaesserella parasuis]|uniref:sugar nucleotide-binding protein n=1 Tax=Glaesserella parasuis TaxID=738 RepID=UPI003B815AA9
DIATTIRTLLESRAAYGVYNVTSTGSPQTWYDIARDVYHLTGHDPNRITGVTTEEYFADATGPIAPRPRNSVLAVTVIDLPSRQRLQAYLDAGEL